MPRIIVQTNKISTLKQLLKQNNISKTLLADKLKLSRTHLSTVLNQPLREMSVGRLEDILNIIGLDLTLLIIE